MGRELRPVHLGEGFAGSPDSTLPAEREVGYVAL